MKPLRPLFFYLFTFLLFSLCPRPASADRYTSLATAKQLTVNTVQGTTYYYIVSNMSATVLELKNGQVQLGNDLFDPADVKSMRVKNITQFILDEDSVAFGANYTIDHGMLVLRRSLVLGQWNSLVLPLSLTAEQVREAFGDEAQLATVRGLRENDYSAIDIETIPLDAGGVVLNAHQHYLIMPTREPDVASNKRGTMLTGRPLGPIYLIPKATMNAAKKQPDIKSFRSDDGETSLVLRGTYVVKDGSAVLNRKLYGGTNPVYLIDEEGRFAQYNDSVLVKAFSSWFADMSATPQQLHFYIDGVASDATQLTQTTISPRRKDSAIYDLQGRLVVKDGENEAMLGLKPGIYVREGRKFIVK